MDDFHVAAFSGMAHNRSLTCMSRLTAALKLLEHYEKLLDIDWEKELAK